MTEKCTQGELNKQSIEFIKGEMQEQRQDIRDMKKDISSLVELSHKQNSEIIQLVDILNKSEEGRTDRITQLTKNSTEIDDIKQSLMDRKKIDIGILLAVIIASVKSFMPRS